MLHQWECSTISDLSVMMHSGAREFLLNIRSETSLGFEPVVAVVSVHRTALKIKVIGVIADLILGWFRRGRGKLF